MTLFVSVLSPTLAQDSPGCFAPRFSAIDIKNREQAASDASAKFGAHSLEAAEALVRLADCYTDYQPEKSLPVFQQAVSIYEEKRGDHATIVADTLCKMAHAAQMHGDYASAELMLTRGLAIYAQPGIVNDRGMSRALAGLSNGYLSGEHKDPNKALFALQRALKLDKIAYGEQSAHVYNELTMLSMAYRMLNKSKESALATADANKIAQRLSLVSVGQGTAAHSNMPDIFAAEEANASRINEPNRR